MLILIILVNDNKWGTGIIISCIFVMKEIMKNTKFQNLSENKVKRIGLFGGTFNPVHVGHLRCMVEVKEALELDQILVIPAKDPPHKKTEDILNAKDRVAMIQKALSGRADEFKLSDVEISRKGPSYTIDTVKYYLQHSDAALIFILGLDAFLEIEIWRDYQELFDLIPMAIMIRPGAWEKKDLPPERCVEDYLSSHVSSGYKYSASRAGFFHPDLQPIYLLCVTSLDISSTKIRHFVKNGRSIAFLVVEEVENYIIKKGFYR